MHKLFQSLVHLASVPSPNEVHQRFKELSDECELLALNLKQPVKAKQRSQWLGEMKVILDNMDELLAAQDKGINEWRSDEKRDFSSLSSH